MRTTLALPVLLALSACSGGGGPPFNSVPGTELYVGCVSDLDCPVELPTCRTHRFFVAGQTFDDNETLEVVTASQCTVPCGPDVGVCPQGIVTGPGGNVVGVAAGCAYVDVQGVVAAGSGTVEGYCFAVPNQTDSSVDPYVCTTVGTVVRAFSDGVVDYDICVP